MVFGREMRRNLKALMIWVVVLGALNLLMLSVYPQIAAQTQNLQEMIKAYPEPLRNALGMDSLDFGTLLGYYGIEVHFMITMLGSVYAAILAGGMLAKEETDKTAEFLLSKPITRHGIVMQKGAAVAVNVLLLNTVSAIASLCGFQFAPEHDVSIGVFGALVLAAVLLHLGFAASALLLSAAIHRSRTVLSLSLGFVFVSYFLQILSGMSDRYEWLQWLSLFHYADAGEIIAEETIGVYKVLIMFAVIGAGFFLALIYYRKKDIKV
jgi:ABC-2 type transport system permease protein